MTRKPFLMVKALGAYLVVACVYTFSAPSPVWGAIARDYSVELMASVSDSPPLINLKWRPDANATKYTILRKLPDAAKWETLSTLSGDASGFQDALVEEGVAYEYQALKVTSAGYEGYGYICAGIRRKLIDFRGKIVLIVEQSLATFLIPELAQLQRDLIGDGWIVIRHDVGANDPVTSVKALIKADVMADPGNVKALFLFGHVPVPYSGDIAPDGHPNHQGAWPADVYYGEFDGSWTDSSVNSIGAADGYNRNIPGDGKFDQSVPPGNVRLAIGRVDLSNMTCFANKLPSRTELDLARQYLQKDHNFRFNRFNMPRRGLVFDHRGTSEPDPIAGTAWRSFPGFFGDQIREIGINEYLPLLKDEGYLWSYVCSSGSMIASDYVGSSDDMAQNDPRVVFTSFLGSYFADWNRESNFLRAPLGTTSFTLVSIFGGQPQWMLHPMALGETIGNSARLTQNNSTNGVYPPFRNYGVGQVHIALMGDPTLRLHPVTPLSNLGGRMDGAGLHLEWQKSTDPEVFGYIVYRSVGEGPFVRLSSENPQSDSFFVDASGQLTYRYMVRAVKLETTASGTYFNASQGIFFPDENTTANRPKKPEGFTLKKLDANGASFGWFTSPEGVSGLRLQRRTVPGGVFETVAVLRSQVMEFTDPSPKTGSYLYRLQAFNSFGDSDYSVEVRADFISGTATFIGLDSGTRGSWVGAYGRDGYVLPAVATNLPSYVQVATENAYGIIYEGFYSDPKGLLRPDGLSRVLSSWYAPFYNQSFSFKFRFADHLVHRVGIYFLDWADPNLDGHIEIIDSLTGNLLASHSLVNSTEGGYLIYDLSDNVEIRAIPGGVRVSILSGLFFDTPVVDAPKITPLGGEFAGKELVTIQSTPGSEIRFTTDGSDPTETSGLYTAPLELRSSMRIKAKAFKPGYSAPSVISLADFTNTFTTKVDFDRVDTVTRGDWPGVYGQEAYRVVDGESKNSAIVDFPAAASDSYLWTDNTTEVRALRRGLSDQIRLAACWSNSDEIVFDLTIFDKNSHPVALYFMDWDHNGRIQDITVSDLNGPILDQRRVDGFGDGKYLVWTVKGSIRFSIKRIQGNNSILNGLFVGSEIVPPISTTPAVLGTAEVAGNNYHMQIEGEIGQTFAVEASDDLIHWSIVQTNTLLTKIWDFVDVTQVGPGTRIYRARLVP